MADVTISSPPELVSNHKLIRVLMAEAATAGMSIVENTSTSPAKWYKANCNDDIAENARVAILMTDASLDSYGYAANTNGQVIDIGGTVVVSTEYVVSDTDGLIMPASDLTAGQHYISLGIGKTAARLRLNCDATGIDHP